LPTFEWESQIDDDLETFGDGIEASQRLLAHLNKFDPDFQSPHVFPLLARTTVSTSIAKTVKAVSKEIPVEFRQYSKVFSDAEAQRLPKHQPWDHPIDLLPGKQMRKTSVYRLTPQEKLALKEYIEEGLTRGTLC
jgi:hypothetical protein